MKSISRLGSYALQHVYTISIPGCTGTGRVFVGQRKDPFVVTSVRSSGGFVQVSLLSARSSTSS